MQRSSSNDIACLEEQQLSCCPPYGRIEQSIVSYFRISAPCTNIEAELRAACHALHMIEEILRVHPCLPIQLCTDSQYVLQVLNGSFVGTHHASVTNDLICRWSRLCLRVEACHVRAHKGFLLNEIADHFAKQAAQLTHSRKVYRTLSSDKARLAESGSALRSFVLGCDSALHNVSP